MDDENNQNGGIANRPYQDPDGRECGWHPDEYLLSFSYDFRTKTAKLFFSSAPEDNRVFIGNAVAFAEAFHGRVREVEIYFDGVLNNWFRVFGNVWE